MSAIPYFLFDFLFDNHPHMIRQLFSLNSLPAQKAALSTSGFATCFCPLCRKCPILLQSYCFPGVIFNAPTSYLVHLATQPRLSQILTRLFDLKAKYHSKR